MWIRFQRRSLAHPDGRQGEGRDEGEGKEHGDEITGVHERIHLC